MDGLDRVRFNGLYYNTAAGCRWWLAACWKKDFLIAHV